MTKEELAIAVINLRRLNAFYYKMIREEHPTRILPVCDEKDGPSFREGRQFWAEVRRLTSQDPDES